MDALFVPLVVLSQVFAVATLILLGVWTGNVLGGFAWDGSMKQFNFHPLFMIIGMVIINGDAIMIFRLFPMLSKSGAKLIHLVLQGIVVVLGGFALKGVFAYHNANKYANVHNVHSWVGFPTYLMFGLQWLCGFLIFFFPQLAEDYRTLYMPLHRYFGVALLALSIVATISGIQEEIMFHPPKGNNFNARQAIGDSLGIVIVIFALLIGYLVTNPSYKRKNESIDDGEKQPLATSEMQQIASTSQKGAAIGP